MKEKAVKQSASERAMNQQSTNQNTQTIPHSEEDTLPPSLRILFSTEELSVISQYWSTEYSLRGDKQRAERSRGFEGITCKNYAKWVTKLAMRLLLLCPSETPPLTRTDSRASDSSTSSATPPRSESVTQTSDSVLYVFKSLLYPTCADKAAYLLPYFVVFALQYHYQKKRAEENENASTPRLVIPVGEIAFFGLLASFLNVTLETCDVLSDNEHKHCCSEVLTTLNTLEAWRLQSQVASDQQKEQAWRGEMLRGFLGLVDRTQVIRVAKLLGQFEYALRWEREGGVSDRESETRLMETRCTTQEQQRYMTTDYASLKRDELDALLMLYFKLQSPMMTKGIETLLERVPGERSLFQQARDLEMKAQWDVATEKYRQLFVASGETEDVAEEGRSAYYRCLQSGGLWSDVLHVQTRSDATRTQSTQLLYWKMEASWRRREWSALRRLTNDLQWLLENNPTESGRQRQRKSEERGVSFAFEYYLSKVILAFQQNRREDVNVGV